MPTKITDQVAVLKRIIRSKEKFMDDNIAKGVLSNEQAIFDIQCLKDSIAVLSQVAAIVKPMI